MNEDVVNSFASVVEDMGHDDYIHHQGIMCRLWFGEKFGHNPNPVDQHVVTMFNIIEPFQKFALEVCDYLSKINKKVLSSKSDKHVKQWDANIAKEMSDDKLKKLNWCQVNIIVCLHEDLRTELIERRLEKRGRAND